MITEKDIIVGAEFKNIKNNIIRIHTISGNRVELFWGEINNNIIRSLPTVISHLNHHEYKVSNKEKPLDKAFKELDKIYCSHKNTRRDMFFSSRVYLTCNDCGKALD